MLTVLLYRVLVAIQDTQITCHPLHIPYTVEQMIVVLNRSN